MRAERINPTSNLLNVGAASAAHHVQPAAVRLQVFLVFAVHCVHFTVSTGLCEQWIHEKLRKPVQRALQRLMVHSEIEGSVLSGR
jgi:hypothetical protein